MARVLIADKIDADVIDRLTEQYGESIDFKKELEGELLEAAIRAAKEEGRPYDMLVVRSTEVTPEMVENMADNARFMRAGAGYNNVTSAIDAGKPVSIAEGANALAVAELQLAMIANAVMPEKLAATELKDEPENAYEVLKKLVETRRLGDSQAAYDSGGTIEKEADVPQLTRNERRMLREEFVHELAVQTVLVEGVTGNIGKQGARLFKDARMDVVAVEERSLNEARAEMLGISLAEGVDVETARANARKGADIVITNIPLNDQTKGMYDQAFFDELKEGAVFVNTARAGLIAEGIKTDATVAIDDQPAKIQALNLEAGNLMVSTKRGAKTIEATENVGLMVEEQIGKAQRGELPTHVVNEESLANLQSRIDPSSGLPNEGHSL